MPACRVGTYAFRIVTQFYPMLLTLMFMATKRKYFSASYMTKSKLWQVTRSNETNVKISAPTLALTSKSTVQQKLGFLTMPIIMKIFHPPILYIVKTAHLVVVVLC